MIRYADESIADYNSFYSADCTDANSRPSMMISYTPMNNTYELDIGSTMHLFVTGVSEGVTWTSSEPTVASVNSNGVVTGIQVGTATITASAGDEVLRVIKFYVTFADGVYRIVNTTGLHLATSGSIAENTLAKMKSLSEGGFEELCQLWKLKHLGNGYYSIRPMHKLDMALHAGGSTGSSVDIVSIGTSDTLNGVPSLCRWGIAPTADGNSYFINHIGTSSLGMKMDGQTASVDMGVITDISSETQGYFKWMLRPVDETLGGAILYDRNTQAVATNPVREMEIGEVKTLADLSLAVNAYSNTSIAQNFYWQSSDVQVARVDSSTGTVTAVSTGITTITGKVHRAGQYHYVIYTVNIGYPELFTELISLGCIDAVECDESGDGLFLTTIPLSDIFMSKGIGYLAVNAEGTDPWKVDKYYDDWYLYAVEGATSVSYGLYKLREEEHDGYDGDDPGVTISFVALDASRLIQCLKNPSISNQYSLYLKLVQVTGPGTVAHDDLLAQYFSSTWTCGAYLIAEKYICFISDSATNNKIVVPENCKNIFSQLDNVEALLELPIIDSDSLAQLLFLYSQYSRIPNALDAINEEAGYVIFDEENWNISVGDINNLSILEKQAILCCFTANVTFNSFAAEVQFHAEALYSWQNDIPIAGNEWYEAALRADMLIGEEIESGYADEYYDLSSDIVQGQIAVHGEF